MQPDQRIHSRLKDAKYEDLEKIACHATTNVDAGGWIYRARI